MKSISENMRQIDAELAVLQAAEEQIEAAAHVRRNFAEIERIDREAQQRG